MSTPKQTIKLDGTDQRAKVTITIEMEKDRNRGDSTIPEPERDDQKAPRFSRWTRFWSQNDAGSQNAICKTIEQIQKDVKAQEDELCKLQNFENKSQ